MAITKKRLAEILNKHSIGKNKAELKETDITDAMTKKYDQDFATFSKKYPDFNIDEDDYGGEADDAFIDMLISVANTGGFKLIESEEEPVSTGLTNEKLHALYCYVKDNKNEALSELESIIGSHLDPNAPADKMYAKEESIATLQPQIDAFIEKNNIVHNDYVVEEIDGVPATSSNPIKLVKTSGGQMQQLPSNGLNEHCQQEVEDYLASVRDGKGSDEAKQSVISKIKSGGYMQNLSDDVIAKIEQYSTEPNDTLYNEIIADTAKMHETEDDDDDVNEEEMEIAKIADAAGVVKKIVDSLMATNKAETGQSEEIETQIGLIKFDSVTKTIDPNSDQVTKIAAILKATPDSVATEISNILSQITGVSECSYLFGDKAKQFTERLLNESETEEMTFGGEEDKKSGYYDDNGNYIAFDNTKNEMVMKSCETLQEVREWFVNRKLINEAANDDVAFFDVQFGLSHAVEEEEITEPQMDNILELVTGNRIKVSELKTIMDKVGVKDIDKVVGYITQASKTGSITETEETAQELLAKMNDLAKEKYGDDYKTVNHDKAASEIPAYAELYKKYKATKPVNEAEDKLTTTIVKKYNLSDVLAGQVDKIIKSFNAGDTSKEDAISAIAAITSDDAVKDLFGEKTNESDDVDFGDVKVSKNDLTELAKDSSDENDFITKATKQYGIKADEEDKKALKDFYSKISDVNESSDHSGYGEEIFKDKKGDTDIWIYKNPTEHHRKRKYVLVMEKPGGFNFQIAFDDISVVPESFKNPKGNLFWAYEVFDEKTAKDYFSKINLDESMNEGETDYSKLTDEELKTAIEEAWAKKDGEEIEKLTAEQKKRGVEGALNEETYKSDQIVFKDGQVIIDGKPYGPEATFYADVDAGKIVIESVLEWGTGDQINVDDISGTIESADDLYFYLDNGVKIARSAVESKKIKEGVYLAAAGIRGAVQSVDADGSVSVKTDNGEMKKLTKAMITENRKFDTNKLFEREFKKPTPVPTFEAYVKSKKKNKRTVR